MTKIFLQQLGARGTLLTALVVGTVINMYGQILVPCLRGSGAVLADLRDNFAQAPVLAAISIAIGYAFPLLVSAFASTRARLDGLTASSLARFPDLKPDPVFRADRSGAIVEAGARTRALFERHGITQAQDVLGASSWARIVAAMGDDELLVSGETVHCASLATVYLVAASAAPDGVNIYLTAVQQGAPSSEQPGARVA